MATQAKTSLVPSLSFVGSVDSPLAAQLKKTAGLTSFKPGGSVGNGLVIDGQSGIAVDDATIQNVLDSGSLVAIANPTAAHLSSVQKLASQGPGGNPLLVALKKSKQRKGYEFTIQYPRKVDFKTTSTSGGSAEQPSNEESIASAVSSALGDTQLGDTDLSNMYPNCGAMAGVSSFSSSPYSWTCQIPGCDKYASGQTQTLNMQFYCDFYVYWVNGVSGLKGNDPYYVVFLRKRGTVSCGTPPCPPGNQYSQGYFTADFRVHVDSVTDGNGNPFSSGVTVLDQSPGFTEGSGPIPIPIAITVPMMLFGDEGQGTGNVKNSIGFTNALSYGDWGVVPTTQDIRPSWEFYQSGGWNVRQNSLQAWNNWPPKTVDNGDGTVKTMPTQSWTSIPFDTVVAWQFTSPQFKGLNNTSTPPSFIVWWTGDLDQDAFHEHMPNGCTAKHEDWNWGVASAGAWLWQIDLATIASSQNLSGPSNNS